MTITIQAPVDALSLSTLSRKSGLPSSQVHALSQTPDRKIWIATPAGLACYNGAHCRTWGVSSGLASHGLRALACGPDGLLWIGSDVGLDAFDEQAHRVEWHSTVPWPFGLVDRIRVLADGSLLLATARGLVHLRATAGFPFEVLTHLDLGLIVDMFGLPDGRWICALASNEVVIVEQNHVTRVRNPALQQLGTLSALEVLSEELVLVGGRAGLIALNLVADSEQWVVRDQAVEVARLVQDEVWYGAGSSLRRSPLRDLSESSLLLAHCRVNDILVDALNNVWIGTDNDGLHKLSCLRDLLRLDAQFGPHPVYCIRNDEAGQWIGGDSQLMRHQAGTSRAFAVGDLTVWDAIEDPLQPDHAWIATQQGLFRVATQQPPEPLWPHHRVLASPGRCLLRREEEIWVGTLSGLCRIQGDHVQEVLAPDGTQLGYVYTVVMDSQGQLWVGTLGRGLWREVGGQFLPVELGGNGQSCSVYSISFSSLGRALVARDGFVDAQDADGEFTPVYHSEDAVAAWSLCWYGDTQAVLGTTRGLVLIEVGSGVELQRLNALSDGPEWEFTTSRSLALDERGHLHCGINAGHIEVDFAGFRQLPAPPSCHLARLRWENAQLSRDGETYRVRPGKWTVRADIASAWFIDEKSLSYRYKLSGFDENWSDFAASNSIQFSSLPSGRYELMAQTSSPLTGPGEVVVLVRIEVEQKTAVISYLSGLLDTLDESFAQIRNRRRNAALLREAQVMQEEVAAQTSMLKAANDDLKSTVDKLLTMSNSDALTGIGNRRLFDQVLAREFVRCQRQHRPIALALIDVDHFKLYNDHYGHPAGDECLRQIGRILKTHIRTPPDVAARYGGEEFAVIMPEVGVEQARATAERLRVEVAAARIEHAARQGGDGFLSISIGVAVLPADAANASLAEPGQLIALADKALYRAKHAGRNRVELASPEGSD